MTNAERKEILQQTRQAQQLGFKGSVVDVLANPAILQEFVQSIGNQKNQNVEVAATPEQQQQGLRGRSQAELPAQMVFPNVSPNTPFNTVGMKAPINIEKYDEQGHLVKSYENVPPGIANLPMGPQRGTVIETPAAQSGGTVTTQADPSAYSKFYDEINKLGLIKYKKGGASIKYQPGDKKSKYKAPKMY